MTFQRVDTAVVGGGQAGLAISYYLTQQRREHVVLDRADRVASSWRDGRWDSFTLVTPNWTVRLPGFPYAGDAPDGFMTRSEVISHLERYAASFKAPIRGGQHVTAVEPEASGYRVVTASGVTYTATNVIVATGSYQFPKPTALSAAMPANLIQLHSSQYRRPDSLPPGAVLIVGSGDTGCQLTDELCESGRQIYLCVSRSGRRPRRYRGKDMVFWSLTLGKMDQTAAQLPNPGARFAANPHATGKNGGRTLSMHQFARDGVVLLGRLTGVSDGKIELAPDLQDSLAFADKSSDDFKAEVDEFVLKTGFEAPDPEADPVDVVRSNAAKYIATLDLGAAGISTVIWANGYGFDFSWVHLPVLDGWGFPIQEQGVTEFPGLYFLGMNFLHYRKSGILLGVGDDAAHVAAHIAAGATR
jgi:putative flavoprotein involved in K+ transport